MVVVEAATPPPSGVSRLVQLLFGRDDNDAALMANQDGEGADGPELVSVCRLWGAPYDEALADYIWRTLPEREPRSRCLKYARIIRRQQKIQVAALYKHILDASPRLLPAAVFRILEHLYCVLEELSIPLPSGFATHFCSQTSC